MSDFVAVKFVKFGTPVNTWPVAPGSTVGDALRSAGISVRSTEVMTRRQSTISVSDRVYDGDTIYISEAVKGNVDPFEVEIFRLGGGAAITMPAMDGMTIRKVIDQMSSDTKAQFYRANGDPAYEFRITGVNEPVKVDYVLNRPVSGKIRLICSQVVKGNVVKKKPAKKAAPKSAKKPVAKAKKGNAFQHPNA